MTDTNAPSPSDLNVQQEEVQVIRAPARSTPGGGVETMDGPIRSVPGQVAQELGGDVRQVANQQGKQADDTSGNDGSGAGDGADGTNGVPAGDGASGDPAGAQDGQAGTEQHEGAAGGESRTAALEAALEALPEETRTAFQPFQDAYATNGTLTPEEVTGAAAALGVPEALVQFHLAAVQAATPAEAAAPDPVQGELIAAAYEVAGSQEAYAPFRQWLQDEGRTADIQNLSDALDAGKPALLKAAMAPLVAEFRASGKAPNVRRDVTSEAAQGAQESTAVEGYASQKEMIEAQRVPWEKNPRKTKYEADPAYRASVNARMAASKFNGG